MTAAYCQAMHARWSMADLDSLQFLHSVVLVHDGDECLIWPFSKNHYGYGRISIDGTEHIVSRLVCKDAHGPPPTRGHEAAHSCGNGHLACVAKRHLSWKTRTENQTDRVSHGTSNRGERQWKSKLTEADAIEIRSLSKSKTGKELAAQFMVSQTTISRILSGKRWGWLS
jgi:hypothetical protein